MCSNNHKNISNFLFKHSVSILFILILFSIVYPFIAVHLYNNCDKEFFIDYAGNVIGAIIAFASVIFSIHHSNVISDSNFYNSNLKYVIERSRNVISSCDLAYDINELKNDSDLQELPLTNLIKKENIIIVKLSMIINKLNIFKKYLKLLNFKNVSNLSNNVKELNKLYSSVDNSSNSILDSSKNNNLITCLLNIKKDIINIDEYLYRRLIKRRGIDKL